MAVKSLSTERYIGESSHPLGWKPPSLNSVDFKLEIVMEGGLGIVRKKVGQLFVGSQSVPFGQIKISKTIKKLDNKIIECKYENGQWVLMRERTDKSFPNSCETAISVCETIRDLITTEFLLDFIREKGFVDDSDLMPPLAKLQSNSSSSKYAHNNQRR